VPDAWLLAASLAANIVGLGWLALAMDPHWRQAFGARPQPRVAVVALRCLAAAALFVSLLLCLQVDHASMAALVWVMGFVAAALAVAFTLSWRPRLLRALVIWAA
jgi:hypothetical protein